MHALSNLDIPLHLFLGSSHRIQQGVLVIRVVIINFPPLSTEELLYGIQKWGRRWEEMHHHTRVCCKPLIDKARVVECHIFQDNDKEWYARPQKPSLLSWYQPLMRLMRPLMSLLVLCGPIVGIWPRTPSLEMTVHMLAPICPGNSIVALDPMRFLIGIRLHQLK